MNPAATRLHPVSVWSLDYGISSPQFLYGTLRGFNGVPSKPTLSSSLWSGFTDKWVVACVVLGLGHILSVGLRESRGRDQ